MFCDKSINYIRKEIKMVEEEKYYIAFTYACCNRCEHYQGSHSTVFGECWTCNMNVKGDVYDYVG